MPVLEHYATTKFEDWWPLHYYLGVGYEQMGQREDAVTSFKRALQLNGSHIETMRELLKIYEEDDDRANIKKYTEKIKMIEAGIEADRQKNLKAIEEEDKRLQEEEAKAIEPEHIDMDYTAEEGTEEKKPLVKRLGKK